eukprot:2796133-Karenia_brevis.AAC.1
MWLLRSKPRRLRVRPVRLRATLRQKRKRAPTTHHQVDLQKHQKVELKMAHMRKDGKKERRRNSRTK